MGHKLQMYENLRDMLEREVKDIEKKGALDIQSLDNLEKLMTSIKVVDRCIQREEGEMGGGNSNNSYGYTGRRGYSRGSYDGMSNDYSRMPYMNSMNSMDNSMDMSNASYGNSGNSYARRGRDGDSDGRYNESRDNFRSNQSGDSYGYSQGYSRDASRKKMVQKLETLMDDTMSENERKAIQDCIEKIK